MEARRLVIERVERLREERVLEKLCDAIGRWRDEVEVGSDSGGFSTSMLVIFD